MKQLCQVMVSLVVAVGCGGDGGSAVGGTEAATDAGTGTTQAMGSTSGAVTTTGADTGSTTDPATTGSTTEPVTSTTGDEGTTGGAVGSEHAALILGSLASKDLARAQATHDQIAMDGEANAMALGDFSHDVLLGTTMLGTTADEFLAIDQWDGLDGALTLYGDPKFQAAFAMLFAAPPSVELFERRPDWHGWGDLESGDTAPEYWFVVVRGTLAADLEEAQASHDGLAMAGQGDAMALGDVAHVVWLGSEADGTAGSQEFFAVDVWTDDTNIEAFYGDPDFQAAFGALFTEPPTVGVYRSTDWHQW